MGLDERLTTLLLAPFVGMFIGGAIAGEDGYGWDMTAGLEVGVLIALTPD
jgi:hypothetical protein